MILDLLGNLKFADSKSKIPKPNTKTTPKGMCLKRQDRQAVPVRVKKTACSQWRPNMRVADCATVWVCKCLQLIYLSWQSAPCLVAYLIVSVATTELSESVLRSDTAFAYLSLSLETCHPVQCRVNMRARHCLRLQLFAADLSECTPFNPFWNLYKKLLQLPVKLASFEQRGTRMTLPICLCPYVARNQGRHGDKSVRMIHTRKKSARILATPHLSGKEQCWNGRWEPAMVLENREALNG